MMNIGGVAGASALALSRQLMSRWPMFRLIAPLVVGGALVCWLYVAEVAKNLRPTTEVTSAAGLQTSPLPDGGHANVKQSPADPAPAVASLRQGLQDVSAGLEQVKQMLQQERERGDKEALRLATDLAQGQQLMQRETEQARHLAQGLATNLAQELATNIEQMRQALQQQGDRVDKLASRLPSNQPKNDPPNDPPVGKQEGDLDRRLTAVTGEITQVRQAIGAVATDLDNLRQALTQESENTERKVTQLLTELTAATQAAQRNREDAERRSRDLTSNLAQLKELLDRETEKNANVARQTSADLAQAKDAIRHESEQRVRTADELTAGVVQSNLTLHQLTADLAATRAEMKQSGRSEVRNGEHQAKRPAAEFTVTGSPQNPSSSAGPETSPDVLLAKRSNGTPRADVDSTSLRDNVRFLPTPQVDREQPAQPATAAGDAELKRLMSRATLLKSQGDIGAARIVLERAADTGNAQALFELAETFDPVVLSRWGTLGTLGDAARAQELYAKALAGGVEEARSRLTP